MSDSPYVLVNMRDVESEAAPLDPDFLERYGLVLDPDPDMCPVLADWCECRARDADADGDKERGAKFWRLVHHYDELRKGRSS